MARLLTERDMPRPVVCTNHPAYGGTGPSAVLTGTWRRPHQSPRTGPGNSALPEQATNSGEF
ncbi:hypothetical protein [Streptomyces roseochromogenus]|nr:hypothetical protein [Streptomyces roseochromogenus]